jgi:hypothetical protein
MKYKVMLLLLFLVALTGAFECGKQKIKRSSNLINGGTKSFAGQWPWLVTLHRYKNLEFFCGSSLINEKMVITGKIINLRHSKALLLESRRRNYQFFTIFVLDERSTNVF